MAGGAIGGDGGVQCGGPASRKPIYAANIPILGVGAQWPFLGGHATGAGVGLVNIHSDVPNCALFVQTHDGPAQGGFANVTGGSVGSTDWTVNVFSATTLALAQFALYISLVPLS